MASSDGAEKSMVELEKDITCAVCLEHYTEPKILPCCHYYCKQCVLKLTKKQGADKPFPCPECRMDVTLPQGKVDQLPAAFFINRMKAVHTNFSRIHGKMDATCEMCSLAGKAAAFCRQCAQFACAECVKSHQRMRVFSSHVIATLDELKKGGAKEITVVQDPPKLCEDHDEPLKIYCFDCDRLICRDCIIKDHNGHNHDFIKKVALKMKGEILDQLVSVKKDKATLSLAKTQIATTKTEVEVQVGQAILYIDASFNRLFTALEKRKQALLEEVEMKGVEKLEQLSGQEKNVSITSAVKQSVIEYAEQCIEHLTDREIVAIRGEILGRIDEEIKGMCKEGELKPVVKANIEAKVDVEKIEKVINKPTTVMPEVQAYSYLGSKKPKQRVL